VNTLLVLTEEGKKYACRCSIPPRGPTPFDEKHVPLTLERCRLHPQTQPRWHLDATPRDRIEEHDHATSSFISLRVACPPGHHAVAGAKEIQ
jgi:hypothetical protein